MTGVRLAAMGGGIAVGLGCAGVSPPAAELPPVAEAVAAPEPPAPPPAPVLENAPDSAFGAVPGWLGFVARRRDDPSIRSPWTPRHPTAGAVILSAEGWSGLASGTELRIVSVEGERLATFAGVAPQPFGCDGVPNAMAEFTVAAPLAEQLVWLLPPGKEGASSVPVELTESDAKHGTWRIGPLEAIVSVTADHAGTFTVFHGEEPVHERTWEQPPAEGLPLSTTEPSPGVPRPIAAFQLAADTLIFVTLAPSLEGMNYDVFLWREALALEGSAYVYTCAY